MNRMRSPDRRTGQRAGKHFENELSQRYLSPGAFTVLSAHEYGSSPDPPSAPTQYRLTPNTPSSRRRRPQAFSIIAEATSNPGSRSPSPTGRVSPFRGRGFNPIGSRHASPNPSPPPDESRISSSSTSKFDQSPKKSQIPQPTRRSSGNLPSSDNTKMTNANSPKFRRKNGSKLSPHLSKSLTNLSPKNVSANRPPKNSKRLAFEQLSPIKGSSPENNDDNKSQSSPSKIPRSSKSQPTSRKSSPSRVSPSSNYSSRQNSRPASKNASRNASRDTSPIKGQTRIPVKSSYKEVSAKVNSFSKPKPKVPQKPQDIRNSAKTSRSKLIRKSSIGKIQATGEASTSGYGKVEAIRENTREDDDSNDDNNDKRTDNRGSSSKINSNNKSEKGSSNKGGNDKRDSAKEASKNVREEDVDRISIVRETGNIKDNVKGESDIRRTESNSKLTDMPTATTVVSSTTTTATQPLKINADFGDILKEELGKQVYGTDGRKLSATSVSSAMNKMNDTVLNSQTLLKDHHNFGSSKLSPAASAIISLANENNKALDTKSATTALPTIESIHKKLDGVGQNMNHSFSESNKVHMESIDNSVRNNINKTLTPDHNNFSGNTYNIKSANDKLRDARTMIASDVEPIKILVKEKPSDIEVQSGNIRLPTNATNGLNVGPSLPPPQNHDNQSHHGQEEAHVHRNCCSRLLARCKCKRCKRKPKKTQEESTKPTGCFNCRRKQHEDKQDSRTKLAEESKKKRFLDRLICCKSKKIGGASCLPCRKKPKTWVDKVNIANRKLSCKDRFKKAFVYMFCCSCCRKTKIEEDPVSRRESMMSKKKSLTPTTLPPVDTRPKIDISLVEHNSLMRGAIPILPVSLAWFCLICNVFLPGIGTAISGMFCLCLGKPRFSQNDGPKPRIGAFLIDLIIGCGQLFTVLFCLVGWGWSIWWGVIMLKIARKHRRIRLVEERALAHAPTSNENHHSNRDAERGS